MFSEDKVPECRCSAHPAHEDKRKYMKPYQDGDERVVWVCWRCTEISKVPTIQVQLLPKGKAKAQFGIAEYEQEKRRLLGNGKRPRIGNLTVSEDK